jgi:hypothetical protein
MISGEQILNNFNYAKVQRGMRLLQNPENF